MDAMEIEVSLSDSDDKMDPVEKSIEKTPEVYRRAPKWIPNDFEDETEDDEISLEDKRTSMKNPPAKTIDLISDMEEGDTMSQVEMIPEIPMHEKQEKELISKKNWIKQVKKRCKKKP